MGRASRDGVSAPRAWPACRTVHRSRAHRQARRSPPSARRSRLCEDSAIPARRSPPRSTFRRQLSAAASNAGAATRLSALEPAEPVRRYERAAPGEIIHIDIKKLGKFSRTGHRITNERTGQSNTRRGRLGTCASGDRRPFPSRPFRNPAGRKTSVLPALSLQLFNALSFFPNLASRSSAS